MNHNRNMGDDIMYNVGCGGHGGVLRYLLLHLAVDILCPVLPYIGLVLCAGAVGEVGHAAETLVWCCRGA